MKTFNYCMKVLAAMVVVCILLFGVRWCGVKVYEFFGKEYASADREIFEESKPFIHGSIQNLYKMKMEYETADTDQHKRAIRAAVFAQTSGLDKKHLPEDLQTWLYSLQ